MSCAPGKPCYEGHQRRRALAVLGLMALIFLALSWLSFIDSRGQALPRQVVYADQDAVAGKRVFQAYNCMGCHTIVGNGAYFGPDLTKIYNLAGPAWLEAFLPSAGAWPTGGAVKLQLQDAAIAGDAGATTIEDYLAKYPGAAERVARRGGHKTLMPNLPLSRLEVKQLVAFLKYTSEMNNEGWPPVPKVDGLTFPQATPMPQVAAAAAAAAPATADASPAAAASPVEQGAALVEDQGCTGCHSTGTDVVVGPGWGGLYGSTVELADGSTVTADDAYIANKILHPDQQLVKGYEEGVMPSFEGALDDGQVQAITAYIRSLGGK